LAELHAAFCCPLFFCVREDGGWPAPSLSRFYGDGLLPLFHFCVAVLFPSFMRPLAGDHFCVETTGACEKTRLFFFPRHREPLLSSGPVFFFSFFFFPAGVPTPQTRNHGFSRPSERWLPPPGSVQPLLPFFFQRKVPFDHPVLAIKVGIGPSHGLVLPFFRFVSDFWRSHFSSFRPFPENNFGVFFCGLFRGDLAPFFSN